MRRKGGRAGLPARVSGRHVVRGRQSSPTLEVRLGEQARLVKTVKIQVRWAAAQPGQDRRLPSVATHSGSSGRPASDLGWGSSSKTAPGSLSTGSPAGRTPPHGDGSMYSQANVRVESVLRPPTRALPSVIVDTEKVLREADGSVKLVAVRPHTDGKVFAPGCASRTDRTVRAGRSPKNTSAAKDSVIFSGGDSSKNYGADQQRLQISDLHFDKFPTPATFACWKIRFKTEVCTCSQFPTEAMQWIKEVEMVDSVDELRS